MTRAAQGKAGKYSAGHGRALECKVIFNICEHKGNGQVHGNAEADQRLCFRNTDDTPPILPKSEISMLQQFVIDQPRWNQTWSETLKIGSVMMQFI